MIVSRASIEIRNMAASDTSPRARPRPWRVIARSAFDSMIVVTLVECETREEALNAASGIRAVLSVLAGDA